MLEMRMLDLQAEYSNHDQDASTLAEFGLKPERSKEDIAREYGQCLQDFIKG